MEMGVALDLVITGKTGYRAKLKDSKDLAHGIYTLINIPDAEYELMTKKCRDLSLELFQTSVNLTNWLQILRA